MNPKLIKSFTAASNIAPYRIVAAGVGGVATAADAAAKFIGFSDNVGATSGQTVDLTQSGLAEVTAGGPVGFGDPLMADAEGRAIVAAKSEGLTVYVVGIAQADAAVGDVIPVLVAPSVIFG
jgi:hypothetical protein